MLAGNASELESELPFWVFVDALDEYVAGARAAPPRLTRTTRRSRELAPRPARRYAPRGARRRRAADERYRPHRAVRRLLEALAAPQAAGARCSTTSTGPTPGSIELLGALLRRPPSAAVLLALAVRPRQLPERLSAALERAARDGALTRARARSAEPRRRRASCSATRSTRPSGRALRGDRRQPVLPRAARPRAASAGERRPAAGGVALAGVEVPRAVAAALTEELALLSDRDAPGAGGRGGRGRPVRARARRRRRGRARRRPRWTRSTSCSRRDLVRHDRRARAASASATRSSARAVYEAAPGGWRLGAHERTAAALAARGAPAVERAHHVERSARHGDLGAVAVLREAGEAAAARRRRRRRACSRRRCGCCPPTAPLTSGPSCSTPLAGAHVAVGRLRERPRRDAREPRRCAERAPPGMRVRLIAACRLRSRTCSASTSEAHTRLDDRPGRASRPVVAGGRGAAASSWRSTASTGWTTSRCRTAHGARSRRPRRSSNGRCTRRASRLLALAAAFAGNVAGGRAELHRGRKL